ncbi:MAG: D-tyrosyl-tRNA(Tyr) deacylase [Proteobacteria bacterium]|nr:D-tyrosyl-tRNA(Tyr) deacylase [Pseudomonadota bacterium]MBU1710213.1 D-tyrosyl-tRNA(Tyr) deacylase [Pseudomonadota bacterium]
MRAVVQLVSKAKVTVNDKTTGEIGQGLLVLLGVNQNDSEKDAAYLAEKIIHLRIFQDENGLMNRSVQDVGGSVLIVSQFTLFGDCRKGRRPSYSKAAPPEKAKHLYEFFTRQVQEMGINTATGEFQAMMHVSLTNNGPVTILLDSEKLF